MGGIFGHVALDCMLIEFTVFGVIRYDDEWIQLGIGRVSIAFLPLLCAFIKYNCL